MSKNKKNSDAPVISNFFDDLWKESWTYIKTVVDVVHEPILILDKDLKVMAANDAFYKTFHVNKNETTDQVVYELGNGQWDIPELRNQLEDILPKHTFFKGFEVAHNFPTIGRKVMILNGRQIHFENESFSKVCPEIIMLAIEDITEIMSVASQIAGHSNMVETKFEKRIADLEKQLKRLQKK
jgi:two-component system CheB/CheR fusion protein